MPRRIHTSKALAERRNELRNNPTPEEKLLWQSLKNSGLGYKFRRQHSIGPYIVDFYCPKQRLIIELDGAPHRELEARDYDQTRNKYLRDLEYTVLRFWNSEVTSNLPKVLAKIKNHLPAPSLIKEGVA